jgi:lysozyme family protein
MTTWFDQCFDKLIAHEGGYNNIASDPGGETNFGISKRAYPQLDIRNLTRESARVIYKRDYWDRAQCDKLPPTLAYLLFDCAVNSGIGQAVRFLQRGVGVADDGVIGQMTIAAVTRLDQESLCARFVGQRLDFMTRLSTWDTFSKGWARRLADQLKGL